MSIKGTYGRAEHFSVQDSIGIPHRYCPTPNHHAWAADHWGGRLGENAIEDAEKNGARCGLRGCQLSYAEHETALLIKCEFSPAREPYRTELNDYLKSIHEEMEANGYVGFTLMDSFSDKEVEP